MIQLRSQTLGQQPEQHPWRGILGSIAFLTIAYFFVSASETPEWARGEKIKR